MTCLETRIPPPLAALAVGGAMGVAATVLPGMALSHGWQAGMSAALGAVATVVSGAAFLTFRRVGTTVNPVHPGRASTLVTTGVFRITRNPMYVGLTSGLASWAAWLGVWETMAGPLLFAWFTHRFQILPEERALRARFGAAYDAYCGRVRRWL